MSAIEWTDVTWNPVRGCSRVSPGCDNCYAMKQARRQDRKGGAYEGLTRVGSRGVDWSGRVRLIPEKLDEPLRWRKPRRVFVNSMSDLFHESLPDEAIDQVFAVMALAQQHTFQVLTKRARRMREYMTTPDRLRAWCDAGAELSEGLPERLLDGIPWFWDSPGPDDNNRAWLTVDSATDSGTRPLPNVWLGVSAEDQQRADERVPELLETPAAVRFLSCEPLLGPLDLHFGCAVEPPCAEHRAYHERRPLHWVIVGGESGPGARPCDVAWIRAIVQQCREAGVPAFCKQFGSRWSKDYAARVIPGTRVRLHPDPKGGDPDQWPPGEWPREFPQ